MTTKLEARVRELSKQVTALSDCAVVGEAMTAAPKPDFAAIARMFAGVNDSEWLANHLQQLHAKWTEAEREQCAKLCDDLHANAWKEAHAVGLRSIDSNADIWGTNMAIRIRARGGSNAK